MVDFGDAGVDGVPAGEVPVRCGGLALFPESADSWDQIVDCVGGVLVPAAPDGLLVLVLAGQHAFPADRL